MHLRLVPPEGSAVVRPAWLRMDSLANFFIVQSANRIFFWRAGRDSRGWLQPDAFLESQTVKLVD